MTSQTLDVIVSLAGSGLLLMLGWFLKRLIKQIDDRFDKQDAKFDGLQTRLTAIEQCIASNCSRHRIRHQ